MDWLVATQEIGVWEEMNEWLSEQLKTIRNLTLISELLIEHQKEELLPTVLEYMFEECQDIIRDNCVKE